MLFVYFKNSSLTFRYTCIGPMFNLGGTINHKLEIIYTSQRRLYGRVFVDTSVYDICLELFSHKTSSFDAVYVPLSVNLKNDYMRER